MKNKPEHIKTDWNIEACFINMRKHCDGLLLLTKEQQNEIVRLINKYYIKKDSNKL